MSCAWRWASATAEGWSCLSNEGLRVQISRGIFCVRKGFPRLFHMVITTLVILLIPL